MSSTMDRLRKGEAVEFGKGRVGRLNLETKTLETSDGRRIYVGDDPDFFPPSEQSLSQSRARESVQKEIGSFPLGEGIGETLFQAGQTGIFKAGQDWVDRFTLSSEESALKQQARQNVSEQISKESPYRSLAGTALGLTPDFLLTHGMSGAKAGGLLTGLHAGPRILDEPGQVLEEAAIGAGTGKLLDIGAGWLGKSSKRREASRQIPLKQAEVRAQNLATQTAETERFNALKSQVQTENAAQRHQYQLELNARKNKMIEAENAKTAAKNENVKLNQEYQAAKRDYETALKEQPKLQREAQKQFSNEVVRQAEKVSRAFPKNSKIPTSELNIEGFLESEINQAGIKGTPEANRFTRIVKGIFPEGEEITSSQLAQKYVAIEKGIQEASPQTRQIFNKFKDYLGERLPTVLADELAYHRIIPSLKNSLMKDAQVAVGKLNLAKSGLGSEPYTLKKIELTLDQLLERKNLPNFLEKLQSGEFAKELKEKWITPETFQFQFLSPVEQKTLKRAQATSSMDQLRKLGLPIVDPASQRFETVMNVVGKKIDSQLAKAELKSIALEADAEKRLGTSVRKTLGEQAPLPQHQAPIAPAPVSVAPEPIPPLPTPPMDAQVPPFTPTPALPEPTLPPPQGMAEIVGDLLEKPLLKGKGPLGDLGPLGKLAGLKYVLGKGALPIEAGYLALKGLTAPGTAGLREGLRQGGVEAIVQLASKYPSYQNGIIQNPRERRSFTKELEESEIPLEEKAVFQSKVNRGIPLWNSLQ